jgi:hypothetical protein
MNTATGNANALREQGESALQSNGTQIVFPPSHTVKGRVLGALLRGERLTHLDCWRRFGSSRLSHHVYCARRSGWPVGMLEEDVKTSDADRTATTARIEAERRAA